MYLNKVFTNPFRRRQNCLHMIYASKSVANVMMNMDADLYDMPHGVLEDKLSIPEIQIYQNEVATIKENLSIPLSASMVDPLDGRPGVPLEIPRDTITYLTAEDLQSDDGALEEKLKGLFNVYIDGYTVIIYPQDSLASIISKIHKMDLSLVIYLTLAKAMGDPGILDNFHKSFRQRVLNGLVARTLKAY